MKVKRTEAAVPMTVAVRRAVVVAAVTAEAATAVAATAVATTVVAVTEVKREAVAVATPTIAGRKPKAVKGICEKFNFGLNYMHYSNFWIAYNDTFLFENDEDSYINNKIKYFQKPEMKLKNCE